MANPLTAENDLGCHFYPAEKCPLGAAECRKEKYCPRQHAMIPEALTSKEISIDDVRRKHASSTIAGTPETYRCIKTLLDEIEQLERINLEWRNDHARLASLLNGVKPAPEKTS